MVKHFYKSWHHSTSPTAAPQSKGWRWWQWLLVSVVFFLSGLGLVGVWWFWDFPLLTPLTATPTFQFLSSLEPPRSTTNKVVYGYVPYWNLDKTTIQPELTHLSYFSLTIGGDGSLITRTDEGGEPGYAKLTSDSLLELTNQLDPTDKVEITLAQFNNDDIVSFLTSAKAHQKLLESLDSMLLAYPVSGINIDIEYTGEITPKLRRDLTNFMRALKSHMDQNYQGIQISIAMYASGAQDNDLWEVAELGKIVDHIVVMAYDFHRRSSPLAGPVAPLFGGKELWDSDISEHLQDFLKLVPSQKLLLGVPFYGYEWQTTTRDAQAHAFPETGSTASFKRVQELLARKTELAVEEQWNDTALSPYLSYEEDGETFVVYYENSRSISYKLDFVNQLQLGGIAIWALGYEGDSRELWDVINQKLGQKK